MITVFYDGMCGLCSKEIQYYRRLAPSGLFVWQDIARDSRPLLVHKVSQAEALRYLHALDHNGRMQVGVDAFIAIWRELPRWQLLGYAGKCPLFGGPFV